MVNNPDGKGVVKDARQRWMAKVGLHDVHVFRRPRRRERRFNRVAQINSDDVARAPTRRQECEATLAQPPRAPLCPGKIRLTGSTADICSPNDILW